MSVFVIADYTGDHLSAQTLSTITAALELGPVTIGLCLTKDNTPLIKEAQSLKGIESVHVILSPLFENAGAEIWVEALKPAVQGFQYILAPASSLGKNVLPRLSATLDVPMLSDVSRILGPDTFERPIYAGNAIETLQVQATPKVITIRATAFERVATDDRQAPLKTMPFDKITTRHSKHIKKTQPSSDRPELSAAAVVISGGRGLQSAENFKMLEDLATHLGAALGASRAAVDAGFVPNDYQVGQTGKVVAPDLYIAVGISGAIQHLAGMKDSGTIVAINKDPDAPIFKIADYGYVGDLFEAIPAIIKGLSK